MPPETQSSKVSVCCRVRSAPLGSGPLGSAPPTSLALTRNLLVETVRFVADRGKRTERNPSFISCDSPVLGRDSRRRCAEKLIATESIRQSADGKQSHGTAHERDCIRVLRVHGEQAKRHSNLKFNPIAVLPCSGNREKGSRRKLAIHAFAIHRDPRLSVRPGWHAKADREGFGPAHFELELRGIGRGIVCTLG